MKKWTKLLKRSFVLFMALVLCLGMIQTSSIAASATEPTTTPELTETSTTTEMTTGKTTPGENKPAEVPTEVPAATEVPESTEIPKSTETPAATEAPEETETPEATETPIPSETPDQSAGDGSEDDGGLEEDEAVKAFLAAVKELEGLDDENLSGGGIEEAEILYEKLSPEMQELDSVKESYKKLLAMKEALETEDSEKETPEETADFLDMIEKLQLAESLEDLREIIGTIKELYEELDLELQGQDEIKEYYDQIIDLEKFLDATEALYDAEEVEEIVTATEKTLVLYEKLAAQMQELPIVQAYYESLVELGIMLLESVDDTDLKIVAETDATIVYVKESGQSGDSNTKDEEPEDANVLKEKILGLEKYIDTSKAVAQSEKDSSTEKVLDEEQGADETVKLETKEIDTENKDDLKIDFGAESLFAVQGKAVMAAQVQGEEAQAGDALGTEKYPYGSLAEAVSAINGREEKDFKIVLLSDLTATECARINSKNVIIDGQGRYTITRGDGFVTISDNARSWYNPAIIEVCGPGASLRLENITIDDAGKTAGSKYSQASTDKSGGNDDIVQDGVIATYDGVGTITLGSSTTLKGYGGMSAVRLSGGTLVMESGSKITGGKNFTTKGGGNGPAGAVWIQGGSFTMEEGASIEGVVGRAVYLDGSGSKAIINGTISGIIPNSNMWQGSDGTAMHVRNESTAILGATGRITDIDGGSCVISVYSSSFTAEANSEISGTKNTKVANINIAKAEDKNPHIVLFDGKVDNCGYGDVLFWAWYGRYIIGSNAMIQNTTANSKGVGMFYLQNGGEIDVRGKIQDNNNTVVYTGNQGGGATIVKVSDGAYIHNNQGYGIYANNSGHVIMEGGEISENSNYGIYVRSKKGWPDAKLEMSGGKIINNKSYGFYYATYNDSKSSYVNITGGEISGNGSSYSPHQVYISGANAEDGKSRVYIKGNVVKEGNGKADVINTSFGQLSKLAMDGSGFEVNLGNAKSEASNKIKELVKSYKVSDDDINVYEAKGSALWFKLPSEKLSFVASRSYSVKTNLPLYVAYIPLNADGTPLADAKLTVKKVNNEAQVKIDLTSLASNQPYALMWMQPTDKYGTVEITSANLNSEVKEELGESSSEVKYKIVYTLPKNMGTMMKAGDEITIVIEIDSLLTYDNGNEDLALKLSADDPNFELVGSEYNNADNVVTATLKLKDDFKSGSKAELNLGTTVVWSNISETTVLETNVNVSGNVILSEGEAPKKFDISAGPCKTTLIPLPEYEITHQGGSTFVKEGTELNVDSNGGSLGEDINLPEQVMEDMSLPNPARSGYTFTGWSIVRGTDGKSITFTAQWRANGVSPTNSPSPSSQPTSSPAAPGDGDEPTTPGSGTGTIAAAAPVLEPPVVLTAPVAAAPALALPAAPAPAVVVAPEEPEQLTAVEDEEVPLADGEDPEPTEVPLEIVNEEEVPLATANIGSWSLVNLLSMLITAAVGIWMTVNMFKKKEEEEDVERYEDEEEQKRRRLGRIIGLIPMLVSILLFFFTENLKAPMGFVNRMTPLMLVFAVIQVVLLVVTGYNHNNNKQNA